MRGEALKSADVLFAGVLAGVFAAAVLPVSIWAAAGATGHNALTAKERAAGWKLLFDGHTMTHWMDPAKENSTG